MQRQVFFSRQCLHCLEVPQLQFIFVYLRMHSIEMVHKTVEVPQLPLRGVSSSWTMSLTCPFLCCSSTRWSMSLLCRRLVIACATWSRSWRHAQIMEILKVIRDVVRIVASCRISWKSWRCTALAMWSRLWRHVTDHCFRGGDRRCSSDGWGLANSEVPQIQFIAPFEDIPVVQQRRV